MFILTLRVQMLKIVLEGNVRIEQGRINKEMVALIGQLAVLLFQVN